ncbi:MAG: uracil-DNA glycosylase, partial [Longimicrobiales bacterium]
SADSDASPDYSVDSTARAGAASMTREQARAALSAMFAPDVSVEAPSKRAAATVSGAASSAAAVDNGALAVLAGEARGCTRCRLSEGRTNVVFGEGSAHADVVVVGEAPGQEEDRTGRPFVGRAGKLLDLLLASAGYPRRDVYICNVLKCRPPSNRNPQPDEVSACTTTWLHAQLEAIAPKVVIAVGKFAAQTLCASEESVGRLRGRIHTYRGTPLIATYHPAYLLRSPEMVRVAWQDFQLLRKVHDEQA